MKKTILTATLLMLSAGSVYANALHLNPQQQGSRTSMQTFGKTSMPIGYYEYCKRFAARCAIRGPKMRLKLTQTSWRKIVQVNWKINTTIEPVTDKDNFGVEEYWTYPKTRGDCEDYALLKRKILNENGAPLSSLLVTVVKDESGGGHAVLTVVTDKGDFILDNQNEKVVRWQDAELTYLKRQSSSNPNVWVSLK